MSCLALNKKYRHPKRQKAQSEEMKQASELDSDMIENLKISDQEFRITRSILFSALVGKKGTKCKNKWLM